MPVTGGSQSSVVVRVPVPAPVQQRPRPPVSFGAPAAQVRTPAHLSPTGGAGPDSGDDSGAVPPHPPGALSAVVLPWNPAPGPKRMRRVRIVLPRALTRGR